MNENLSKILPNGRKYGLIEHKKKHIYQILPDLKNSLI